MQLCKQKVLKFVCCGYFITFQLPMNVPKSSDSSDPRYFRKIAAFGARYFREVVALGGSLFSGNKNHETKLALDLFFRNEN